MGTRLACVRVRIQVQTGVILDLGLDWGVGARIKEYGARGLGVGLMLGLGSKLMLGWVKGKQLLACLGVRVRF